ncbi:MAG TPA: hypothetical protein VM261_31850 [Kofleriaceae bacterium]|nr:hypothetical protein [Kofleriaceae bacterium]
MRSFFTYSGSSSLEGEELDELEGEELDVGDGSALALEPPPLVPPPGP